VKKEDSTSAIGIGQSGTCSRRKQEEMQRLLERMEAAEKARIL